MHSTQDGIKIEIYHNPDLTDQERLYEDEFSGQFLSDPDKTVAEYEKRFGGEEIEADKARQLYHLYGNGEAAPVGSPEWKFRSEHAQALDAPSGAIAHTVYIRRLNELDKKGIKGKVVLSAGGTASGKTTAMRNLYSNETTEEIPILAYGSTLSTIDAAVIRIEEALQRGHVVEVNYFYRNAAVSWDSALDRANRTGRIVSVKSHISSHIGALETVKRLIRYYDDNKKVAIRVIDNSSEVGGVRVVPAKDRIDFLNSKSYNKEELERRFHERAKQRFNQGDIKAEVYRGANSGRIRDVGGLNSSGHS
jgi:hypothetical protein